MGNITVTVMPLARIPPEVLTALVIPVTSEMAQPVRLTTILLANGSWQRVSPSMVWRRVPTEWTRKGLLLSKKRDKGAFLTPRMVESALVLLRTITVMACILYEAEKNLLPMKTQSNPSSTLE